MPDHEHESAVAAWLDHADTRREMQIIASRFPRWNDYQVTTMALMMELVVALNIYGSPTLTEIDPNPDKPTSDLFDDDDPPEPWR
jgi:hypothetical protein